MLVGMLVDAANLLPLLVFPALAQPSSTHVLYSVLSEVTFPFVFLFVPCTIGIAMLRYRLWDIDLLINRTLVYGLLTHQGRKTGRIRQTVLEIPHYNAVTQECQVIVFYGEHADWYCNIQAHPALEVQVGRQRYVPQQRELSPEEVLSVFLAYQHCYPWAFRLLPLFGYPYDGSRESVQAIAMVVRGVAFRP